MKVLTTAGLTKLIELCKNAIPTVPVTDVTVGGTSVVSSGVAVVPAIPTVNDSTITITQGGVTKGSFTLNQATGDTIALDAGGGDVEWAIYGTTTHQQISDWANAGKEVLVKSTNGVTVYRLVHVDVSEHIFTAANLKAISYCYVTSQNAWYSSSNDLQTQIPAGTAGNVITYTGTAGSIGSATLATVATTGAYSDLSGTPTIPTVNDSTIIITQGGVTKGSFTLNQASGDTIALDAGGVTAFQAPTAQNNYTWYRKYADGWVEQGGRANGNKTVSLPITMSDANYETIINVLYDNSGSALYSELGYVSKTTTNFTKGGNANVFNWVVYGMAA